MRRSGRTLRTALNVFWWQAGEQAMIDLANTGAVPPLVTDLNQDERLLRQHVFDEQRRREREGASMQAANDADVTRVLDAMVVSLPEEARETRKAILRPQVKRMLSQRQSAPSIEKFRKLWKQRLYVYEGDNELLDIRDALRLVFETGNAATFLSRWGRARTRKNSDSQTVSILTVRMHGRDLPLPEIDLRLVISMSILGVLPQMTRCANPDCANPYFVRHKTTQRYCDTPACIAHGQRMHKLKWWREHGQERKKEIQKAKKRAGNKARSKTKTEQ